MEDVNENEDECVIDFKIIIDDLNSKAKTAYKHTSKKTHDLIKARINEGFTQQDFFTVHTKKVSSWKNDPDMLKFLRPETLYGNKFEGYLNEIVAVKKPEAERLAEKHSGIIAWARKAEQNE